MLNKKKIQLLSGYFLWAVGAIMFVGGLLAGERTIAGLGSHDWMGLGALIYSIGSLLIAFYYYKKYHKR